MYIQGRPCNGAWRQISCSDEAGVKVFTPYLKDKEAPHEKTISIDVSYTDSRICGTGTPVIEELESVIE